jgi:hypothetical protein
MSGISKDQAISCPKQVGVHEAVIYCDLPLGHEGLCSYWLNEANQSPTQPTKDQAA